MGISLKNQSLTTFAVISLVIGIGVGVRVWAALQWSANFDSDEAIIGLMARHTLQGRIPTYYYGQTYLGSLDAILAAVFIRWLGNDPFALRIPSLLLFGLFLILHAIWVRRVEGWQVVAVSLLILVLPQWRVFHYTYKPNVAFGLVAVIGTLSLLLVSLELESAFWSLLRWIGMGALVGLGIWIHPITLIYFATWMLTSVLQSREWKDLRHRLDASCRPCRSFGLERMLAVGTTGVLGFVIIAFFTNGCQPAAVFASARSIALVTLGILGALTSAASLFVSKQRLDLMIKWGAFLLGAVIGNIPQWKAWLFWGVPPSAAISPSCPTEILMRTGILIRQLLPSLWGSPTLLELTRYPTSQVILWGIVLLLGMAATGKFIWDQRHTFWSLFSLSPLPNSSKSLPVMQSQVFLLFAISMALVLLGGNTTDDWSVRYLLVGWQAFAIIFALGLGWIWDRSKFWGFLILGFWVWRVALGNVLFMEQKWHRESYLYSTETVSCLEDHMEQQNVLGGHADYWLVYVLDFLMEEQFIFTPYQGENRYPEYTDFVSNLPVQAVILWHGDVPPLMVERQLDKAKVLDQRQVCNWDVWIVDSW